MAKTYSSWGNYPKVTQAGCELNNKQSLLPEGSILPYGNGRSYGDSCLNKSGLVVSSSRLDNFIHFDPETGVLRCEAGVTLAAILNVVTRHGWFLPVTPGTKFVTVAGAVANDVHGKNHHLEGTFGCHVKAFELLRSDGSRLLCSANENQEWFAATIGGLGLTGFITWVEIQLKRVTSTAVLAETIKYQNLSDFFTLSKESDKDYEYTVAWIDCLASGDDLGRGHFIRGNHAPANAPVPESKKGKLSVPFTPPISLINQWSLKAFNHLYYERQQRSSIKQVAAYDPFFYPLDGIHHWNRIYGRKGFVQWQCALPMDASEDAMQEILQLISKAKLGSFLAVLKVFGEVDSPGWLSFPMPGATLALDFPVNNVKTLPLLDQLDKVVVAAAGRIYPAKDARMKAEDFQQFYPRWKELEEKRDPNISSDFWRRVTGEAR